MRRSLNVRVTIILLALTAVAVGGVYLLHGIQLDRNSSHLLENALSAWDAGEEEVALQLIRDYLRLVPGSVQASQLRASWMLESAKNERDRYFASMAFEDYLRKNSEDFDARRQIIQLLMGLGRYEEALEHVQILRSRVPDDGRTLVWTAECQEAGRQFELAATTYRSAIKQDKTLVDAYAKLARLIRRKMDAPEEAGNLVNDMVANNLENFQAYLLRSEYHREFGNLPKAQEDLEKALELAPYDPDILLSAADLTLVLSSRAEFGSKAHLDQIEKARGFLKTGVEKFQTDVRFYRALAKCELKLGKMAEAQAQLRAGLLVVPNDRDLKWTLADLLISAKQIPEAEQLIEELSNEVVEQILLDYLRARIAMFQERWFEASRLLTEVAKSFSDSDLAMNANLHLGECWDRLGNPDLQVVSFRSAKQIDLLNVPARRGLAKGLLGIGRLEEAITEYRSMMALPEAPAYGWTSEAGWAVIARLLVIRNLRMPKESQNWKDVEAAMEELSAAAPNSVEVLLLRTEVLVANDQLTQARELLREGLKKHEEDVRVWVALANLDHRANFPAKAEEILAQAEAKLGKHPEILLAWGRLAAMRKWEEAQSRLKKLEQELTTIAEGEQYKVTRGIAEIYMALERYDDARRMWLETVKRRPNDLFVYLMLFDTNILRNDHKETANVLEDILRIEGATGIYGKAARAALLIDKARRGSNSDLKQARSLLLEVRGLRPGWYRISLYLAQLEEILDDDEASIKYYQLAVDQGDRTPETVQRLVSLLYRRRRFRDADQILRRYEEQPRAPITPDLSRLAAEISLQTENQGRAVTLARQAVANNSNDHQDLIWLARIESSAGNDAEATQLLHRSVELKPDLPDTWIALILHLLRINDQPAIDETINEVKDLVSEKNRALILGQCYDALDRPAEAEVAYKLAISESPGEAKLLRQLAGFYLRSGQVVKAEPIWREMINPATGAGETDVVWARRGLAVTLATSGNHEHHSEALKLLDQNLTSPESNDLDLRTKAGLLAVRGNRVQRAEAIKILEDIDRRTPLLEEDVVLVSELYEMNGDLGKARDRMQSVVLSNNRNPVYLSKYIAILLRRNEQESARIWLEKLAELIPDSADLLILESHLEILQENAKIVCPNFENYVEGNRFKALPSATQIRLLGELAATLENFAPSLKQTGQEKRIDEFNLLAVQLFQTHAEYAPGQSFLLGNYLARHGDYEKALEVYDQARKFGNSEIILGECVGTLKAVAAEEKYVAQVARWCDESLDANPKSVVLLVNRGLLAELQGNWDLAEKEYLEALNLDPQNLIALNNLSYLWALTGKKVPEALEMINQCISIYGPMGDLIDTKSVILRKMGEANESIFQIELAIRESEDAMKYFHKAMAHLDLLDRSKAKIAYQEAISRGLQVYHLHSLERTDFKRLSQTFNN